MDVIVFDRNLPKFASLAPEAVFGQEKAYGTDEDSNQIVRGKG
jgi:hypothetical protein